MAMIVKRAKSKSAARGRRHLRVRKKVSGTALRPRSVVSCPHATCSSRSTTPWARPYGLSTSWRRTCARSRATRPPRPARWASCSPSVPRAPVSRLSSSTVVATSTTAGSRPSPTAPARVAVAVSHSDCEPERNLLEMRNIWMPGPQRRGTGAAGDTARGERGDRRDRRDSRRGRRPRPGREERLRRARGDHQPRRQGRQGWPPLQLHRSRGGGRRRRHCWCRLRQGQGGPPATPRVSRRPRSSSSRSPASRAPSRTPSRVRLLRVSSCSARLLPVRWRSPVARCAPCSSAPASTTC